MCSLSSSGLGLSLGSEAFAQSFIMTVRGAGASAGHVVRLRQFVEEAAAAQRGAAASPES